MSDYTLSPFEVLDKKLSFALGVADALALACEGDGSFLDDSLRSVAFLLVREIGDARAALKELESPSRKPDALRPVD